MKSQRVFPFFTLLLCITGTALCTLHWLSGFDFGTGLPSQEVHSFLYCILFFIACAVVYAIFSMPARKLRERPYESLFGSKSVAPKAALVACAFLLLIGAIVYFVTMRSSAVLNTASTTSWMEYLYIVTIAAAAIGLLQIARNLNTTLTKSIAFFWSLPFLFASFQLLVEYRLTCTDPKLSAFALQLIASICMVFGYYYLAKMLFGKPFPERFSFFSALAFTIAVSNTCGYALAHLSGMRSIEWDYKTIVRSAVLVIGCVALFVQLMLLSCENDNESNAEIVGETI